MDEASTIFAMIRAQKVARRLKKRAVQLLAEKKRRENTGKIYIDHMDQPPGLRSESDYSDTEPVFQLPLGNKCAKIQSANSGSHSLYGKLLIQEGVSPFKEEELKKFSEREVGHIISAVLRQKFDDVTYEARLCSELALSASEMIKLEVKQLGYTRLKLICYVLVTQNTGQGLRIASMSLLNRFHDNFAQSSYQNRSVLVSGIVYGLFHE